MSSRFRTEAAPLSRAEIVDTAVRVLTDGDEPLTVRGLARALDCSPMALYRHVHDRDDILLAVADRLLAERAMPRPSGDPAHYLTRVARSLRDLLRDHPGLVELFARRPVTTPVATARLEAAVDVLGRAGFDQRRAVAAYAAVHTYTLGFCMLEAGRAAGPGRATAEDGPLAAEIAGFVTGAQFERGLQAMIAGLVAD